MFFKKSYFLYIENTNFINFNLLKNKANFSIIYRNNNKKEKLYKLQKFLLLCKRSKIKLFIANDTKLALKIGSDGIYLSSYNRTMSLPYIKNFKKMEIIGSAHNFADIHTKLRQGCRKIILSRVFKTNYVNKKTFYGITKFNLITKHFKNYFIALGGIREQNLNKLKLLKCNGVALLSEVKKKPAIIRRLF